MPRLKPKQSKKLTLKDLRILKVQHGLRYEGSSKTGRWVIWEKEEQ